MTNERRDGFLLVLLGSLIFVMFGWALESSSPAMMGDFRMQYYPARTLVHGDDPYSDAMVLQTYRNEAGNRGGESIGTRWLTTEYIYPPTAFAFTAPLALLPYAHARTVWMLVTAACLIFAGFLTWDIASTYSPLLSGALIGFLLGNSELLLTIGNVAGIAIGFAVIGAWCFVRGKFVGAGVLCMAASLALKPQDTCFIWLYFLLSDRTARKYALQTLATFAAFTVPVVALVTHMAPHWPAELRHNMQAIAAQGGTSPVLGLIGSPMIVDLRAAVSFFDSNVHHESLISYFVCSVPLLVWCLYTLRSKPPISGAWLSLGSIAAFTMLPVYHRQCDAKILLLTIPACAILHRRGGWIGRIATLLTVSALLSTADIPWVIVLGVIQHLQEHGHSAVGREIAAAQLLLVPLVLLAECTFFLWATVRLRNDHLHAQP